MGAYTPFTFRGLAEYLILAEDRIDSLGNTPLERSDAAIQLINTALIASATAQQLPITIVERNQIKHRQMMLLFAKNPRDVGALGRFLRCTIPSELAVHDAENERAGGWKGQMWNTPHLWCYGTC